MTTSGTYRPHARAVVAALATAGVALTTTVAISPAADARPAKRADSTIALPDGFQPEGIATGNRTAYLGSRANGDIYAINLSTGRGGVLSDGPGTVSLGLKLEKKQNRLYVSGGDAGTARIVDAGSGDIVADLQLTDGPAFINDVILTRKAAWFTNSSAAELYRVPIFASGKLPRAKQVSTFALRGDWVQPDDLGANGITRTPDRTGLLVVNSTDGTLFRVETKGKRSGKATQVDLGKQSLTNGDGMLQQGRRLSVVRNALNRIVTLRLDKQGLSGRKVASRTSRTFDVPTTIAAARGRLYLPNARFSTPPKPSTTYSVSVLKKR